MTRTRPNLGGGTGEGHLVVDFGLCELMLVVQFSQKFSQQFSQQRSVLGGYVAAVNSRHSESLPFLLTCLLCSLQPYGLVGHTPNSVQPSSADDHPHFCHSLLVFLANLPS